jgi:predicted GH43/DUF377 family glycosyl hydrolase
MTWHKKGLIYAFDRSLGWAEHSASKPAPIVLDETRVRVFVGCRDGSGVSRIGFVDLDAKNPSRILRVSRGPVLDIGTPGMFDDNGVVPCVAVRLGSAIYLYYEGYQLGTKVKFTSFAGLAISRDDGETFERWDRVPVLDRAAEGSLVRVIHAVLPLADGRWRVFYTAGSQFVALGTAQRPHYQIFYQDTDDGVAFSPAGSLIVGVEGDEYRVGKPSVLEHDGGYLMLFSKAARTVPYRVAAARSPDSLTWQRAGDDLVLEPSAEGWDSQMVTYPYLLRLGNRMVVLYNGNNYGETGFGWAEWRA